jgi:hypothetical protein
MSNENNEKRIAELKAEVERRSHPAAAIFPMLIDKRVNDDDGNPWEAFLSDVAANKLRTPILIDKPNTTVDWRILDGRNRQLACLVLGIEPKYEVANVDGVAAVKLVISANLSRRHDDPSVRAMQVVKLRETLKVAILTWSSRCSRGCSPSRRRARPRIAD